MTDIDFSLVPADVLQNFQDRTIVDVKNVHWSAPDNSRVDGDVLFQELEALGYVPFSAVENDDTAHGVEFWTKANAGDYGPVAPYVAPIILPENVGLTPDQFYTMLEADLAVIEEFAAAIETVTPISKKLTCRNQFNNSSSFSWDMILMTIVAPKVWGDDWQNEIGASWIAAGGF